MIDLDTAQSVCARLLDHARKHGADQADAICVASSSESVGVRLGELEDVERSEGEDAGLRVFVGQRSASISTNDFSDFALGELAERAVAMARAAPEDGYAGLAPAELLAEPSDLALDMADASEPDPALLRERALETEDSARAIEGVTNSNGASAGFGRSCVALATSEGFLGGHCGTSHSLSASMIAGEGSDKQRDYAGRTTRHLQDLPPASEIGREAGERTVAKLHPDKLPSGPMPVVFDPRIGGSIVGHLVGAMSGAAVARGGSFLIGKEDEALFPEALRIVEDPHRPRGLRSRPFDGEGLPTRQRALVENGRLTGWLLNMAAARQLDLEPTGHASRGVGGTPGISTGNIHLEPGDVSPSGLMADIEDGVFVTELMGQGVDAVSGDYSRGAAGFRIRGGELSGPVAEFTIAGNLLAMFAALSVADDLEWHRAINVPTLRVDGMTIAGE